MGGLDPGLSGGLILRGALPSEPEWSWYQHAHYADFEQINAGRGVLKLYSKFLILRICSKKILQKIQVLNEMYVNRQR